MKINVRGIQALNLGLCAVFVGPMWDINWAMLSVVMYFLFLGLGVNIGLHRGLSHGLVSSDSFTGRMTLFFSVLACLGRPSEWALVHHLHHLYSDREGDPHSPHLVGRWRVFSNTWEMSKAVPLRAMMGIKRRLSKSQTVAFFDRTYWQMISAYVLILWLGFGFKAVIFGWCFPASLSLLATSLVNTFCHAKAGGARDVWWISLLTFGEGNHRFHHQNPGELRSYGALSFDLSGWILSLNRRPQPLERS